ncbi:MAG: PilZ domain-containing protein [Sulfuricaulis sp.]|nr:PilZ domain-containing protein [Sulfuricaulis sp.]
MPTKQPNPAERRSALREELAQQPKGTLQLYIGDRCIDVAWMRDISPVGVCLQLKAAVDKGEQVQLKYTYNGIQIEVLGTVVWAKAAKLPHPNLLDTLGWWVGIFLHPSSIDANFALYRTIMEDRNDWLLDESGNAFYW